MITKELEKAILEKSESTNWYDAVSEWALLTVEEDTHLQSTCICGKKNLRYLYTLKNIYNGNLLCPIGSKCIHQFGRVDMNRQISLYEKLFKLFHAIENNERIALTTEYFSRNMLDFFSGAGVFVPNKYNHYNPNSDYIFLLNMFNQRKRPTSAQQRRINGLIAFAIKPYLQKNLKEKIRK